MPNVVFVHAQDIKTVHARGGGQKMAIFCPCPPKFLRALLVDQKEIHECKKWCLGFVEILF